MESSKHDEKLTFSTVFLNPKLRPWCLLLREVRSRNQSLHPSRSRRNDTYSLPCSCASIPAYLRASQPASASGSVASRPVCTTLRSLMMWCLVVIELAYWYWNYENERRCLPTELSLLRRPAAAGWWCEPWCVVVVAISILARTKRRFDLPFGTELLSEQLLTN